MEVLHALKLSRCCHAILNLVKCLVWLVNGSIGDRAQRHVELAHNKERVALCTLQATEALHALRLLILWSVILKVAQLTALWVNGKTGDRALRLAAAANKLAPA
jgi:hypothetical protein